MVGRCTNAFSAVVDKGGQTLSAIVGNGGQTYKCIQSTNRSHNMVMLTDDRETTVVELSKLVAYVWF